MDRRRVGLAAVVAAALMLIVLTTNVLGSWQLTPRFDLPFNPPTRTPPPYTPPALPSQAAGSALPPGGAPLISSATWDVVLKVLVVLVALVVVVFVAGLLWRLRRPPDEAPTATPQVSLHETVREAVQTARDYLSRYAARGDVAEAIIGAWAALEDAAAESGHRRRPEQTPSEFTADLLASVSGADAEVAELLGLYHRARYGSAVVVASLTRADADRAVTLLTEVFDQIEGDAARRSAPGRHA